MFIYIKFSSFLWQMQESSLGRSFNKHRCGNNKGVTL